MLGEGVKKPLFKGFSFANTTESAESLAARISEITSNAGEVSIGMEATGHYWLALYSFLFDKGYTIHVINPIQTDGWRKGIEIRKRKTDDIDSVLIADLICYGDFSETKLVAYAGIDASVAQSGEFEATHNRMSKRGSPYLRRALFVASNVAVRFDPDLGAFYQRKRAEGKHHSTCLGAVSRKLCYIIYAILAENRPYIKH